jgi:tetratricopeptide (TPR) repeat protein
MGNYVEAERRYLRAVKCWERAFGEHGYTACALSFLGLAQAGQGKYDKAAKSYREAMRIAEAGIGKEYPARMAIGYANLAGALYEQGDRDGAIKILRKSLALRWDGRVFWRLMRWTTPSRSLNWQRGP